MRRLRWKAEPPVVLPSTLRPPPGIRRPPRPRRPRGPLRPAWPYPLGTVLTLSDGRQFVVQHQERRRLEDPSRGTGGREHEVVDRVRVWAESTP